MRWRVIDAIEHHVFERDEIARRFLDIAHARSKQLTYRILAVDRYQVVTQLVVRCVQDTASATGKVSRNLSIAGTRPEVDSVTRRRESP